MIEPYERLNDKTKPKCTCTKMQLPTANLGVKMSFHARSPPIQVQWKQVKCLGEINV